MDSNMEISGESFFMEVENLNRPIENLIPNSIQCGPLQVLQLPTTESSNIDPNLTEDAAEEMLLLLDKWGFSYLYDLFIAECIDLFAMAHMTPNHLLHLCSSKNVGLGTIIKFEHELKKWQQSVQTTADISKSSSRQDTYTSNETPEFCIKSILLASTEGKSLMRHYENHGTLNDGCRSILLDIIVKHAVQNNIKISSELSKYLSNDIIKIFPNEKLGMYYVKQDGKRAISKIYSKFFNYQRTLKDCGLIKKRPYGHATSSSKSKQRLRSVSSLNMVPEEDVDEQLREIEADNISFGQLEISWAATSKHRCKRIAEICLNKMPSDVLHLWPHFKKALGFKLIDIDFHTIYGKTNFVHNFEQKMELLINILREKIRDNAGKVLLTKLSTDAGTPENVRNLVTLYLIHSLLPPVSRDVSTTPKRQCSKYSIKDSQNSMLLFGETISEIENKLIELKNLNLPIQPFVIIRGNLLSPLDFTVYFDGCRYKFQCILQAIDICFKTFLLFNLEYPQSSILVWNFLQKAYYEIETQFDLSHTSINSLMNKFSSEDR